MKMSTSIFVFVLQYIKMIQHGKKSLIKMAWPNVSWPNNLLFEEDSVCFYFQQLFQPDSSHFQRLQTSFSCAVLPRFCLV